MKINPITLTPFTLSFTKDGKTISKTYVNDIMKTLSNDELISWDLDNELRWEIIGNLYNFLDENPYYDSSPALNKIPKVIKNILEQISDMDAKRYKLLETDELLWINETLVKNKIILKDFKKDMLYSKKMFKVWIKDEPEYCNISNYYLDLDLTGNFSKLPGWIDITDMISPVNFKNMILRQTRIMDETNWNLYFPIGFSWIYKTRTGKYKFY